MFIIAFNPESERFTVELNIEELNDLIADQESRAYVDGLNEGKTNAYAPEK